MAEQTIPEGTAAVSLTLEQIAELKLEILLHAPYTSRTSLGLALRLVEHPNDIAAVLREIDALEGVKPETTVKCAEQFKHPPLFPFWHKHYFASRHALRNVGERWNIARGHGNRELGSALSAVAKQYGHDPDIWPGAIARRVFVDGLTERASANRLTGDWIIFAKHDGQNYYLDLAQHEEADGPINSAKLMQKLLAGSAAEFPFLFPKGNGFEIEHAAS
jgi:hypothetical protein